MVNFTEILLSFVMCIFLGWPTTHTTKEEKSQRIKIDSHQFKNFTANKINIKKIEKIFKIILKSHNN